MTTNSKEVSKKIQEHILDNFDSYKDMMTELKNHQKVFGNTFGKTMVDNGTLLFYDADISQFLQDVLKQTPEEQKKYSRNETYDLYANLVQRECNHIISEDNQCYIKPDKQQEQGNDVWIADKEDESETLSHTFDNNEKVFFRIEKGSFGNGVIGLKCFPNDPGQLEKRLWPDHIFSDKYESFNDDLELVKNLVGNTIKHFDQRQGVEKSFGFEDVKNHLHNNAAEHQVKTDRVKDSPVLAIGNKPPENVWYKGTFLGDECFNHTFDKTLWTFGINNKSLYNDYPSITYTENGIGNYIKATGCSNDMLKQLVENTVEHFNEKKDINSPDVHNYLVSQIIQNQQKTRLENQIPEPAIKDTRQNESLDRQLEQAKKMGYVQGVCECVAIVGEDKAMGMKLLSEMKVTKGMAKQYAEPETYKVLEQTVFAPKVEHKKGRPR